MGTMGKLIFLMKAVCILVIVILILVGFVYLLSTCVNPVDDPFLNFKIGNF